MPQDGLSLEAEMGGVTPFKGMHYSEQSFMIRRCTELVRVATVLSIVYWA